MTKASKCWGTQETGNRSGACEEPRAKPVIPAWAVARVLLRGGRVPDECEGGQGLRKWRCRGQERVPGDMSMQWAARGRRKAKVCHTAAHPSTGGSGPRGVLNTCLGQNATRRDALARKWSQTHPQSRGQRGPGQARPHAHASARHSCERSCVLLPWGAYIRSLSTTAEMLSMLPRE
jgi:hypothetical protein